MVTASVGLFASMLAVVSGTAPEPLGDCDSLYYGGHGPRDFAKALACYRAHGEWDMVAIMQLNGEGTPVDVAGARASYRRLVEDQHDGDTQALDEIIKQREAHPAARGRRIEFCGDVAQTTISLGACESRELKRKAAKDQAALQKMRANLPPGAHPAFDRAVDSFRKFVRAEGDREYQQYIDGTIRGQAAMDQEQFVRRDFIATMKVMAAPQTPGPPVSPRPSADADRELNAVYKEAVRSYEDSFGDIAKNATDPAEAATYRTYVIDYKAKSRSTQHAWVLYRDAMAKLAETRWPTAPAAADQTRALITEDRIRELRNGLGD
jgi:uncharacterized protein YecT (DUF1311 family)